MSARALEEVLAEHVAFGYDRMMGMWVCTCGKVFSDAPDASRVDEPYVLHRADAIREWLLSDERVGAACDAMFEAEFTAATAGHLARAALAAAVGGA